MPATSHSLTDYPPPQIYLDTNFFVSHLVSTDINHQPATDFFVQLATCNVTTLYISSLTWLEFMHVVGSAEWRARLPPTWHAQYQLHRWQDAPVRRAYLQTMRNWLEQLLMAYPWAEIDLTSTIAQQALQYVEQYNLDTHDAAHWASARAAGVLDLASFDRGFRRVDGLQLWTR